MKLAILQSIALLVITCAAVFGQQTPIFSVDNQAIRGYDPVAYFTENKPVQGNPEYSYTYQETNWLFSSAANRDAFKAEPEKYMPQYGGYCAYGLSEGHKSPTDPNAWTIVDDKLYLNYNTKVKTKWTENRAERIEKANKNWPTLKDAKE